MELTSNVAADQMGAEMEEVGGSKPELTSLQYPSMNAPLPLDGTPQLKNQQFYSKKPGSLEESVGVCSLHLKESDGKTKGAWLLTEIDHWDVEKERIFILTEFALVIFKVDFITRRVVEFRKIYLASVEKVALGPFVRPPKSLMPQRRYGGVRMSWDLTNPVKNKTKWNPWSKNIPYITAASHPLFYDSSGTLESRVVFSVDDFIQKLVPTVQGLSTAWESRPPSNSNASAPPNIDEGVDVASRPTELTLSPVDLEPVVDPAVTDPSRPPAPTKQCLVMEQPISCESFVGLPQIVHNQSFLGFFRERGGISY